MHFKAQLFFVAVVDITQYCLHYLYWHCTVFFMHNRLQDTSGCHFAYTFIIARMNLPLCDAHCVNSGSLSFQVDMSSIQFKLDSFLISHTCSNYSFILKDSFHTSSCRGGSNASPSVTLHLLLSLFFHSHYKRTKYESTEITH